ncbi:MAG: heparan-alpha-glucosaminide N-acetyltransferase domain-containing protein [Pseudomonadota bacterium]
MSETSHSKPASNRLNGLDLARYLAFVGMVIVNFKIAMGAEGGSGLTSLLTGALEGRAAATFVVLAGIGLGLAARKRLDQTVAVTFRRALFLLAIGLLNMTVFDADILHFYAFYFLFGAFMLGASTRLLLWSIAGLNLLFVVMILALDYDAGWNWQSLTYQDFWTPTGFVRHLFFNGWHPVIPWLAFLLLGIVLSRLALGVRGVQLRMIAWGAGALVLAEALSWALSPLAGSVDPELIALVATDPVPPMPLYMLAGSGAASLVIGLCLMGTPRLETLGVFTWLLPAGRQTLTLYIAHILIGMGTLEALGLLGGQTAQQALWASLVFCICATLFAYVWSRFFKRGPVEALMRRVAG